MRTIALHLAGQAAVVQVNTRENPRLAGRFGIRGIPALVLLKGGQVAGQLTGAQPAEQVLSWFRQQR